MKDSCSALCSEYVIDGIRKTLTPWGLLMSGTRCPDAASSGTIVDESIDPSPIVLHPDPELTERYAETILTSGTHPFPVLYSAQYTRIGICRALTDVVWRKGHFRLCDLSLDFDWEWNDNAIGNMAAFYASAESAAAFLDELSVATGEVNFKVNDEITFHAGAKLLGDSSPEENDLLDTLPCHTSDTILYEANDVPPQVLPEPQSWIIYIPFDTCDYRLGGSALSHIMGATCGIAPEVDDADYFQDCFEIIREMVEDGVIISGRSICEGGLYTTLIQYFAATGGIFADISDILHSRGESVAERILFSEIPGVLIQIRDIDYDYFDAQMLLQDVEYFPLGHPVDDKGVTICNNAKSGISRILEAILGAQSHEGED